MIYRIHFESKGAYWCIQFSVYGVLWRTVTALIDGPAGEESVERAITFDTYEEAEKYVKERGIDKAYLFRNNKGYVQTVASGAINFNVPHGWKMVQEA